MKLKEKQSKEKSLKVIKFDINEIISNIVEQPTGGNKRKVVRKVKQKVIKVDVRIENITIYLNAHIFSVQVLLMIVNYS